jgi:predicted RNA-binding protein
MKYWLCVANEENWKIVKKLKIWGVPKQRKSLINKVEPEDRLIIYIKTNKIGGIFKADSKPFESEELIFKPIEEEIFPCRIKIKALLVPKDPIDFRKIISKLAFIKHKRIWGAYIRGAMRTIPEGDYKMIESTLVQQSK